MARTVKPAPKCGGVKTSSIKRAVSYLMNMGREGYRDAMIQGTKGQRRQMNNERCEICGESSSSLDWRLVCKKCIGRYGDILIKAQSDMFDYALGLSDGSVYRFHSAIIEGDWVYIYGQGETPLNNNSGDPDIPYMFYRGLCVRADAIIWCADAPNGS